jgi:putative ABC transport system permease protein
MVIISSFASLLPVALLEGICYAFVGIGVWLTFRVLSFPDLSIEGVFPLGAVVTGTSILFGINPIIAMIFSICAGLLAGIFTAVLNTKLGINNLLSGILTTTGLYSINLTIMHGSNIALLHKTTSVEYTAQLLGISNLYWASMVVIGITVSIACILLYLFLHTQLGLILRATGQNEQMVRSIGINTDYIKWMGLACANGFVALSGSLVAQVQGFADVGMGVGSVVIGLAALILGERLIKKQGIGWAIWAVLVGSTFYRIIISLALRLGLGAMNLKLVTMLLIVLALSMTRLGKRQTKP